MLTEICLLRNHRAARCEIANASVAEPAALRFDIAALGDSKLAFRSLNELLVLRRGARDLAWIDQVPTVGFQRREISFFIGMNTECERNVFPGQPRQLEKLT